MKKNRNLSAFSLIELSIVIVIIGILVAGVAKSTRLISQARINTAKSLTRSSPIASITGISLWIETTLDESFKSSLIDDETAITSWYDVNPQSTYKADFSATTAPTYRTGVINNLPAIKFTSASSTSMSSTNFPPIATNEASIFFVVKTPSTITNQSIFSKRVASADVATNLQVNLGTATQGWQFCDNVTDTGVQNCYNAYASGTNVDPDTTYIISITYVANAASSVKFYKNGVIISGGTASSTSNSLSTDPGVTTLLLGKNGLTATPAYFDGYIGELVIFDRFLRSNDRVYVEKYLGSKWGIPVP